MMSLFLRNGALTLLGVMATVALGVIIAYVSLEYVPWVLGKYLGLSLGIGVAAVGGFSGRAAAIDSPPPFANDPLGWRKAKQSYKEDKATDEKDSKNGET